MEMVRQVLSVLAVFGLLGAALWVMRRGGFASLRGLRRDSTSLESIERLPLTPQHALHLVKIRGRELVVATHPQGCALLLDSVDGAQE
ncbi:MAG: flagellar biosynthetic protein FliO [Acidobacteriia bacterium]|nr:flagellar biosynthetic protein FliO [Terriglobia bacterium]